jgi:ABC-type transport system substrate-binding protein
MTARITIASVMLLFVLATFACMPGEERERRLAVVLESAPLTLDPRGAFNADTAHVQQLLFNTLVTKGPDFDFAPELAERWDVADDFTSYVFFLRRGVRFHDGRELTSRDVAHTFNSLVAGGYGKSGNFHALERVEPLDAHAVRFVCRGPNPGLLVDLVAVGVVPEGAGPETAREPVGTGPFRVAGAYAGEGDLRLDAFVDHFKGRPGVDGIDLRVIRDAPARVAALRAGEVDLAINAGLSSDALAGLGDDTRIVTAPGGGVQFVVLNAERPPLGDPRVRRALSLAVDRDEIVATYLGGRARVAAGPLPPGHWAAAPIEPPAHHPDLAGRLIDEAGARGTRLELMALPGATDQAVAAILAESWRRIGVETTVVPVEAAVFFERLTYGEFGAALHRFTGGNQFTTIFKGAFHSRAIHRRGTVGGELNYGRFADPEIDALIDRADLERDYAEVQRRIVDATPWLFLWHPDNVAVAGPRVGPFQMDRGGDFYFLRVVSGQ